MSDRYHWFVSCMFVTGIMLGAVIGVVIGWYLNQALR